MTDEIDPDFSDLLTPGVNDSPKQVDRKLDAQRQLKRLTRRELAILYLYAQDLTQAEIGVKMGLSQRHIGRILEGIAKKAVDPDN